MIHAVLLSFFALTLTMISCSSKPPEKVVPEKPAATPQLTRVQPAQLSLLARQLANEQRTDLVTEFRFKESSGALEESDKKKLKALLERAASEGEIKEVQLITWGDKEYPTSDRGSLSQKQKRLVETRNDAIKNYLLALDGSLRFRTVSMAKRPGKFSRFLSSKEARLKDSMEEFSIPETNDKTVRSNESQSIVIIIPDRTQEAE